MPLRILVVEDEVLISEVIRMYLEEQNHDVVATCISYDEAVVAYNEYQPDFVVIDIRLYGEKSGVDFAAFLQTQTRPIPFIYLTSQNDRQTFNQALETVPYGYVSKPISKVTLWNAVSTASRLFEERINQEKRKVFSFFDGEKTQRIAEEDILFIQSEHVYARLILVDKKEIILRKPLYQILEDFKSDSLYQCHRSYIVNTKKIASYKRDTLTLFSGDEIPVSRTRKSGLKDFL